MVTRGDKGEAPALMLTGLRDRRQADHMGKTQDGQETEDGVRGRL